jgi:hypothetical protein
MKIGKCKGKDGKKYKIYCQHGMFVASHDNDCFDVNIIDGKVYYKDNVILFDDICSKSQMEEIRKKYAKHWVSTFPVYEEDGTLRKDSYEVTVFEMEDGMPKVIDAYLGDLEG